MQGELSLIRDVLDAAEPTTPQAVNEILVLLRRLELLPVTLPLLEATGIGRSLNALKKRCSHPEVRREAHMLLADWKSMVAAGPQGTAGITSRAQNLLVSALSIEEPRAELNLKALAHEIDMAIWGKIGADPDTEDEKATTRSSLSFLRSIVSCLSRKYLNCQSSLTLRFVSCLSCTEHLLISPEPKARSKYKAAMMKIVSNLKLSDNSALRQRILRGDITPDQLAGFDGYQLATPSAKAKMDQKRADDSAMMKKIQQRSEESYDPTQACKQCGEYKCVTSLTNSCGAAHAQESIPDAIFDCKACGHSFTSLDL